jgi:hypothetical protein
MSDFSAIPLCAAHHRENLDSYYLWLTFGRERLGVAAVCGGWAVVEAAHYKGLGLQGGGQKTPDFSAIPHSYYS